MGSIEDVTSELRLEASVYSTDSEEQHLDRGNSK